MAGDVAKHNAQKTGLDGDFGIRRATLEARGDPLENQVATGNEVTGLPPIPAPLIPVSSSAAPTAHVLTARKNNIYHFHIFSLATGRDTFFPPCTPLIIAHKCSLAHMSLAS